MQCIHFSCNGTPNFKSKAYILMICVCFFFSFFCSSKVFARRTTHSRRMIFAQHIYLAKLVGCSLFEYLRYAFHSLLPYNIWITYKYVFSQFFIQYSNFNQISFFGETQDRLRQFFFFEDIHFKIFGKENCNFHEDLLKWNLRCHILSIPCLYSQNVWRVFDNASRLNYICLVKYFAERIYRRFDAIRHVCTSLQCRKENESK